MRLVAAVALALALAGAPPGCAQSGDVMPPGAAAGSGGQRLGTGGGDGGRPGSGTGGGSGAAGTTANGSGGATPGVGGGATAGAGGRVTAGAGGRVTEASGGSAGAHVGGSNGGHDATGSGGVTASGGTPGSGGTAGAAATFTQVYKMILNVPTSSPSNCAGATCHIPGSSQAHVKFDTQANAYRTLRSVAIIPGNATGSILYTNLATGVMPDSRPMISDALLQLVESWIDAGALND